MNRTKRFNKSFVSGGLYDPNTKQEQSKNNNNVKTEQIMPTVKSENPSVKGAEKMNVVESKSPTTVQQDEVTVAATQEFSEGDSGISHSGVRDNCNVVDANGKVIFRKIFGMRKKASVRAKEKRLRQNRRLRKTIIPKNALMALHEVKGLVISDFSVSSNLNGGFTATVTVNNILYEGQGNSKTAAKNNASEKALRDYIIAKMRQNPRAMKNGGTSSTAGSVCNDDITETTEGSSELHEDNDDADDVPMVNLASFALYKLFSEWEREGYSVPELHPPRINISDNESNDVIPKELKKPPKRDELPSNWESMHPASLLCVMRPGVTYIDKGRTGTKPNEIQLMAVVVDNHEFVAQGRSKKTARHNVAAVVCNSLFKTNFVKVESITV